MYRNRRIPVGAKSAAANEILIAGSTTLYPAELNIKADYERQNPGVQINVQQGGSGVGVNSVGMGISDIGASSFASTITTAQTNNPNNPAFQNLYYTMIGGRGVVFITNAASPVNKSPLSASNPMTVADLQAIYNDAYLSKGVFTNSSYNGVFQSGYTVVEARESGSGTQQSASNFIFGSTGTIEGLKNTIVNQGNEGELAAIQSTPYAFGLVDAGYAFPNSGTTPATGIIPLPITWNNGTALNTYTPSHTNIKHALTDWNRGNAQDTTSYPNNYPQGLVSGLYWVTQGTVPTASSATGVITSPGTSAARLSYYRPDPVRKDRERSIGIHQSRYVLALRLHVKLNQKIFLFFLQ